MSNNRAKKNRCRGSPRYIFHDALNPHTKTYLIYYYNAADITLMMDGPFKDELCACDKMREFLLKGYCAWMVTYND